MGTNETTIEDMLSLVDAWNEINRRIIALRMSLEVHSFHEIKERLKSFEKLMEDNRGNKNSLAGHIGQQKRQMNPKR